jgi:hypothetical protein
MKRLFTLSTAFLVFFFVMFNQTKVTSNPQQPPAGYANDPDPAGALTCATSGCHSGSPVADSTKFSVKMCLASAGNGALTNVVSGLTTYQADSVYYMSVTANATSGRYGFELTVVDASATPGNMAGSFTLVNTTTTTTGTYQPSGSTVRTYVGHKNANTTNSWTFKWTAPATGKGPLTIYYVGMNSNNNGNTSGDLVYNATKVIAEEIPSTGIVDISSKMNYVNVFPTIFNNNLQLNFDLKESETVKAELISLNGQVIETMLNQHISAGTYSNSFETNGLSAGVYLVRITAGNAASVIKVVKQ